MNRFSLVSIVEKLKTYQPEKVILFGSMAHGGLKTAASDIDLAVIKITSKPFYQRNRDVRKMLRSRVPVDVFVFTPDEFEPAKATNPFIAEIHNTGKVIYDRTS